MDKSNYLAFDIGASSGRAILGTLSGNIVELTEIHRFTNEMSYRNGHYHWDIYHLFDELKAGLRKCVHEFGVIPHSFGIDTWGVDFGLLDENNEIIGWPFAYRDSITDNSMEEVFRIIEPFELYSKTGIQFMKFNSIFQLWAIGKKYPGIIDRAKKLLFMPDLLGFMFTGKCWSERTIASTSQLIDPKTGEWLKELMEKLGLPHRLMQEIVEPGTVMGNIKPDICSELNCPEIPLVASCEHDTASAIASIPAVGDDWAYISSGTWSLMGMELSHPVLNKAAYEGPFTNEGGFAGTIRFLKNITGLWLLQECKKKWDMKEEISYTQLVEKSLEAPAFRSMVDPDHPNFMNPDNMEKAIYDYCINTGQPAPRSIAEVTRCIFESLAMKYRYTLEMLLKASPGNPDRLHIIGGGTQNEVLCQYAANATGIKVIAGPAEGAALGNILVQAHASGKIQGIKRMREISESSVETKVYIPEDRELWDKAYLKWVNINSGAAKG